MAFDWSIICFLSLTLCHSSVFGIHSKDAIKYDRLESRVRRQLPEEINILVTAPLFTSRLFEYGAAAGDLEVPPAIAAKQLQLTHPLTFFQQNYDNVYILSNGAIVFEPSGKAMIAPFWNRNDMRKGGNVFYREVVKGAIASPGESRYLFGRAESEIRYQYEKTVKFKSVLLITWVGMQPQGNDTLPESETNTFQAAIFISTNGTYVNFIYKNIGWSQAAKAGFSKGDNSNYYGLPTSGTDKIVYLEENGNTGIPGEWIFQVDMDRIVSCRPGTKGDDCGSVCSENEWGYDCRHLCHCSGGGCDMASGACENSCAQCWTGYPNCQQRDPDCGSATSTTPEDSVQRTTTEGSLPIWIFTTTPRAPRRPIPTRVPVVLVTGAPSPFDKTKNRKEDLKSPSSIFSIYLQELKKLLFG